MSILKQARMNANLSIEDVSRQLNIRKHYIIALEEDKLEEIPAAVYAQGYMKLYAKFLGIKNIDHEIEKIVIPSNNTYTKVLDTFGGRNNLGVATAIIFALIVGAWAYILGMQNNKDSGLVKHLENLEPANYMLNIQEPKKNVEDIMKVDLKLLNIESSSHGLNDTDNQ